VIQINLRVPTIYNGAYPAVPVSVPVAIGAAGNNSTPQNVWIAVLSRP
jgi:hypothetical protein